MPAINAMSKASWIMTRIRAGSEHRGDVAVPDGADGHEGVIEGVDAVEMLGEGGRVSA